MIVATNRLIPGDIIVHRYDDGSLTKLTVTEVVPEPRPAVVSRINHRSEVRHPNGFVSEGEGYWWAGNYAEHEVEPRS